MTKGDTITVRLYSYKSVRHYGGRNITTAAHTCKASYDISQDDHTHVVYLLEDCAGYKKGHRMAIQTIDFNV